MTPNQGSSNRVHESAGPGSANTPGRPGAVSKADPHREDPAGPVPILDVRWQDASGHFLANDSVQSEDRIDPGAYYGVSSRIWATCPLCGTVENPRCIVIGVAK